METMCIEYSPPAPEFAKMVMSTCSLMLKGPGFNVKDQFVSGTLKSLVGSVAAISLPRGRAIIWAQTDDTPRFCWRYAKNLLTKERMTHELIPKTHVRNEKAGMVGSSVAGTVSLTSSIG